MNQEAPIPEPTQTFTLNKQTWDAQSTREADTAIANVKYFAKQTEEADLANYKKFSDNEGITIPILNTGIEYHGTYLEFGLEAAVLVFLVPMILKKLFRRR